MRFKEGQRRHSTAVKATIACVVDIVTVITTAAIIADNRVVVDLGNLRRKD